MANRKYRHNKNESRTIVGKHSDLNGYDDLFAFSMIATDHAEDFTTGIDVRNLFGDFSGVTQNGLFFNWELYNERTGYRAAFKADGTPINSVLDVVDMTAEYANRLQKIDVSSSDIANGDRVIIYINGQFGQLNCSESESTNHPEYAGNSFVSGGSLFDEGPIFILNWGKKNVNQNWERFGKAFSDFSLVIKATDEPRFAEGISLYRAFEDTADGGEGNTETGGVFTNDALETVKSWDSNKFGNGQRVFENGVDQPNLNDWSFSGGNMAYGFYMRNNMSSITDRGEGMVPNSISGWAGYADVSFSNSFQGATGIHNWEKVNTSQCVDMQYFAWKNTRAKSLGTMRNLATSKVANFTAMFGYTGVDSYGAEGELLVDPSKWDMSSATTLFYMLAQEELGNGGSWNGELNWKTCKNVIDLHSVLKNRTGYTGDRLDEFAPYSGQVVLFRSAFAGTAINYDFSNWDFSGVDATRTDVQLNENNASGIMGGFVRDCENMSFLNVLKLLRALNRPFGQGGLPVSGVDAQIGTAAQDIQFGTSYETRASNMGYDIVQYGITQDELDEIQTIITELGVKGYAVTGLEDI